MPPYPPVIYPSLTKENTHTQKHTHRCKVEVTSHKHTHTLLWGWGPRHPNNHTHTHIYAHTHRCEVEGHASCLKAHQEHTHGGVLGEGLRVEHVHVCACVCVCVCVCVCKRVINHIFLLTAQINRSHRRRRSGTFRKPLASLTKTGRKKKAAHTDWRSTTYFDVHISRTPPAHSSLWVSVQSCAKTSNF